MLGLGQALSGLNRGMMAAMQSDTSDTSTDCYSAASTTSDQITSMFTSGNYSGSAINTGEFMNFSQIMLIDLMDQFQRCGYNNYMVVLDTAMSNIPQLIGSLMNGGTQVFTSIQEGASDNSSLMLAVDGAQAEWNGFAGSDWEALGKYGQLGLASLLKYESPDTFKDISLN